MVPTNKEAEQLGHKQHYYALLSTCNLHSASKHGRLFEVLGVSAGSIEGPSYLLLMHNIFG